MQKKKKNKNEKSSIKVKSLYRNCLSETCPGRFVWDSLRTNFFQIDKNFRITF